MLEYEKKLHFDKHYEKLQSSKSLGIIGGLAEGIIGYVLLYVLLKYVLKYLPDLQPWYASTAITKLDYVYFIVGLIAYCYGVIRLVKISAQNHSVRGKGEEEPASLLTDGAYAKVRHPMYGAFIILQASLFFSLRSVIGIILILVIGAFQYFNARWEEKTKLIPRFKEEYQDYSKIVPNMMFTRWESVVFVLVIMIDFIGIAKVCL